jgi:hypothetical protein
LLINKHEKERHVLDSEHNATKLKWDKENYDLNSLCSMNKQKKEHYEVNAMRIKNKNKQRNERDNIDNKKLTFKCDLAREKHEMAQQEEEMKIKQENEKG